MSADNTAVDVREQPGTDLDTAFDALAHSYRRTVIEALERDAPLDLAELAERVAARDDTTTARSAKIELAHRHLPRLDDADVIEYDAEARRCDIDEAETVRSVFATIREVT